MNSIAQAQEQLMELIIRSQRTQRLAAAVYREAQAQESDARRANQALTSNAA